MQINDLLKRTLEKKASDLHLEALHPPVLRIDGELVIQEDIPPVSEEDTRQVLATVATSEQKETFVREKELDFAYSVPGLARFRVNVLRQRGKLSFAFRTIPIKIPTLDEWTACDLKTTGAKTKRADINNRSNRQR